MKRREALKSITLSTGVVISSGTFLSLLQSCREKDTIAWQPTLLTQEEAITVSEVCDLIFPASETPGALDVGVPQFIDLLMNKIIDEEDVNKFRSGLKIFSDRFNAEYGDPFHEGAQEDQSAFVTSQYGISADETSKVVALVKKDEAPSGEEDNYNFYSFLITIRDLTIKSYFSSEKVGEEFLSYDPIPGRQDGCIPVEEIGNVWAL